VELRDRLMRVLIVLVVAFFGLVFIAQDLYAWLSQPLRALLPPGSTMIATDVTSPFMAPFKLAFFVALFIVVPYILVQIWGFISPALYKHEKKVAIPLVLSSIVLFYTGIAFAYFLTLPVILAFFIKMTPEGVAVMTDINSYMDFVLKLFLVFGFTFEVPVATFLLIWSGIVSSDTLTKNRRYIIVGCFFVAMFATPPDATSMAMMGTLMWLLFEAGLFFGRMMEGRRLRAE
jgi:sec-independent protein translocase protein TatC